MSWCTDKWLLWRWVKSWGPLATVGDIFAFFSVQITFRRYANRRRIRAGQKLYTDQKMERWQEREREKHLTLGRLVSRGPSLAKGHQDSIGKCCDICMSLQSAHWLVNTLGIPGELPQGTNSYSEKNSHWMCLTPNCAQINLFKSPLCSESSLRSQLPGRCRKKDETINFCVEFVKSKETDCGRPSLSLWQRWIGVCAGLLLLPSGVVYLRTHTHNAWLSELNDNDNANSNHQIFR